jgi:hypothetical protein
MPRRFIYEGQWSYWLDEAPNKRIPISGDISKGELLVCECGGTFLPEEHWAKGVWKGYPTAYQHRLCPDCRESRGLFGEDREPDLTDLVNSRAEALKYIEPGEDE